MEGFDLNAAVAAYFEQHARNEKALADQKAAHKDEKEILKEEIAVGHRNPFNVALGDAASNFELVNMLKEEIERRLDETN